MRISSTCLRNWKSAHPSALKLSAANSAPLSSRLGVRATLVGSLHPFLNKYQNVMSIKISALIFPVAVLHFRFRLLFLKAAATYMRAVKYSLDYMFVHNVRQYIVSRNYKISPNIRICNSVLTDCIKQP